MKRPLLFYCLVIICLWSQSGSFLFGEYDDVKVTATDTSGNAGTRQSHKTLKMVKVNGSGRTANLEVPDYLWGPDNPKWSGDGVTGADGSLTATFSGSDSTTATAYSIYPQRSGSVDIELVSENKNQLTISENHIFINTIKQAIRNYLLQYEDRAVIVSGGIQGEMKNVDYYNNGEIVGKYGKLNGSVSMGFAGFEVKFNNLPTGVPGLTWKPILGFTSLNGSIGISCEYDESKSDPWVNAVKGNCGLTFTIAAGAAAEAGVPYIIVLGVSATGSATFSATSSFYPQQKDIYGDITLTAGAINGNISVYYIEGQNKITLITFSHQFNGGWQYQTGAQPIISFN